MPTTFGRYEHPYEHDQKLVSAFLRAGERVAFDDELPVRMEDVPSALGSDTAGKLTWATKKTLVVYVV